MWLGRKVDGDAIAGPNHAPAEHDRHDSTDANDAAIVIPVSKQLHQAILKLVDLDTRVTETGQLDGCLRTNPQNRAGGKREQVDASCGDVLAELASSDIVTSLSNQREQFFFDQVNRPSATSTARAVCRDRPSLPTRKRATMSRCENS